jgi:RNA polymerase sigma-B factor
LAAGVLLAELSRLNPMQQQVIRHVVLEGWSLRRTASVLQISPMTVRRLLQQGLDSLRRQLEDAGVRGSGCSRPAPSAAPGC